jgi:CheY-like chemotaxis protein
MARILVIDDEVCVRAAVRLILEHRGHHVVVAECGQYGVAAIEAFAFDAVVVDICMPGMDGFETISILRQSAPKIPIVAISGYVFRQSSRATPGFLDLARELGVSSCLCKPFKAFEIIEAVETAMGGPAGERPHRPGVPAPDLSASLGRP